MRRVFPGTASRPDDQTRPSQHTGLPSSFVLSAAIVTPCSVSGMMRLQAPPCERICRSTPGALAPVRVVLSRSILTYPAPSAPLAGISRLHRRAAYTRYLRCAYSHRPRRPTTGSELSLMLFHNMSPSTTTGNSSVAYTQSFTENAGLQLQLTVSAFPSSSHSDSSEGIVFEA